jgi:fatty acid desaturase
MDRQNEARRVNLGQFLNGKGDQIELKITNETDGDAEARRTRDAAEAKLKRTMTLMLFIFAMLITGCVFAVCLTVAIVGSPDDKKWATSIVTAIVAGLLGYLVGQGKK